MFRLLCVGAILFSLTGLGCQGGSRAQKTVRVAGLVTLDGRPLEGASVNFISEGYQTSGLTDTEGRYELQAVPGDYKVHISKTEGEAAAGLAPGNELFGMNEFEAGSPGDPGSGENAGGPKDLIPRRFSDPAATTLSFVVPESGSESADFTSLVSK